MDLFFLNEDARILDQLRKGDETALVKVYRASEKQVAALIRRNNGREEDAKDVLQEAVIILWERVRSGRYEHASKLSTFVVATARNIWLRRLARARREVPGDWANDSFPSEDPSRLDSMIETEETEGVLKAMSLLGEPCYKLLLLFYWEELSMERIASELGFANADTVKSKKYQCKKELQRLLERLK